MGACAGGAGTGRPVGVPVQPANARGAGIPADRDDRRRVAGNDRVLAISPPERWTLYEMPEAFLPPNSATVYGYYSLNGYDSLSTETYRRWAATVEGDLASPAANGNMLLLSRPPNYRVAGCRYYLTRTAAGGKSAAGGSSTVGRRCYRRGY